MVRDALALAHGWPVDDVEIIVVRTTGDRVQDRALAEIGGKALWTRELDRALIEGAVDACVHSMKDVETIRPAEIAIAAMLPRADVRDRLIGARAISELPEGACVGTSSPRRAAQLARLRPDLRFTLLRGNVDTRLAKVESGVVDATLLAAAGLDRLGKADVGFAVPLDQMLPAPAQGAVGVEVRAGDAAVPVVAAIGCAATMACVSAERALLAALAAGCHSPVAALATLDDGRLTLTAELLSEDGGDQVSGQRLGAEGGAVATELAHELLARAPVSIRALFGG